MRRFLAFLGLATVVLWPSSASAHAVLESSSPQSGSRVEELGQIRIDLSETPEPSLSSISLLDPSGSVIALGDLVAQGTTLMAPIEGDLSPETYLVSWRVFSRVDGHVTAGAFAFGYQIDPAAIEIPESSSPEVTVLSGLGRWLFLLGFALAVGSGVVELLSPLAVRSLPILAGAGALVGALGVALLGHQQRVDSGAAISEFLSTPIGYAVAFRVMLLFAVGALALAWRRWMRVRRPFVILMLFALIALAFVHVANGHAAASGRGQVALQAVHMLAAGAWVGGLVPLLAAVRRGNARRVVAQFSTMALGLVVLVFVTGQLRSFDETGTLLAFQAGTYGRIVVLKSALLVAILWFAAKNRRHNVEIVTEDPGPLKRAVRIEAILAVLVFGVTGVLANVSPDAVASINDDRGPISVTGKNFAGDLEATLRVDPGRPGPNTFSVSLRSKPSDEPVTEVAVSLKFRFRGRAGVETSELELVGGEPGMFSAEGVNMATAGPYEVSVLVQGSEGSDEILLPVATFSEQDVTELGGDPAITSIKFDDDSTVQGYIDPGSAGTNEVHATYFTAAGRERDDLSELVIVATGPDGVRPLLVRQLSSGHAVAEAFLSPGLWRFDMSAIGGDGRVLAAWFERVIG